MHSLRINRFERLGFESQIKRHIAELEQAPAAEQENDLIQLINEQQRDERLDEFIINAFFESLGNSLITNKKSLYQAVKLLGMYGAMCALFTRTIKEDESLGMREKWRLFGVLEELQQHCDPQSADRRIPKFEPSVLGLKRIPRHKKVANFLDKIWKTPICQFVGLTIAVWSALHYVTKNVLKVQIRNGGAEMLFVLAIVVVLFIKAGTSDVLQKLKVMLEHALLLFIATGIAYAVKVGIESRSIDKREQGE